MDERIVEDYRRHQLVAAGRGTAFVGKAWKDGAAVADARGESLAAVLAALRAKVDELLGGIASRAGPPDAMKYAEALRKILPSLSDGHYAMLKAHCQAPNRSMTATQLADAAGYANHSAANLQYGLVGKLLWEEVPTKLPIGSDGNPIFTFALAEPGGRTESEDQWVWTMRPALAAAIKELGLDK